MVLLPDDTRDGRRGRRKQITVVAVISRAWMLPIDVIASQCRLGRSAVATAKCLLRQRA
jgi:hypothetical protein